MTRSEDLPDTSIAPPVAPRHRVVLVTGFGAFPGAPKNPTAEIIAALERHAGRLARLGLSLRREELPVMFDGADDRLRALVARYRPDVILHLGVAGRRRRISIETRAINRAGPLHPDASGRCPPQILVPGAASGLRATYPASRILAALRRHGFDAERSIDAGDYVCNATLYRSLLDGTAPEIGFIHVPKARGAQRPLARVRRPRLSIDAMADAVLSAILAMARGSNASMIDRPTP